MAKYSREERKTRRLLRRGRFRFIKNLFIWLLGVLCIPTILVVTTVFIPVGMFAGNDGSNVSTELSNQSLFKVSMTVMSNPSAYGFSDFPIVTKELDSLLDTQIIDGIKVGDLINVDKDKLNQVKFGSDMAENLKECVEITATLNSVGGTDMLGDFGKLSVFSEWEDSGKTLETVGTLDSESAKLYYYNKSELGTSAFASENTEYFRAFDNEGNPVSAVSGKNDLKLYYPALGDVVVTDLIDIIGESFGRVKLSNLLGIFNADNETIINILGVDTRVADLKDFDINGVKLTAVLANGADTEDLYDMLASATGVDSADDITIGDLTNISINNIKLSVVIPENEDSAALYDVLRSALGKTADDEIKIGDLSGNAFDIDNIELETVLTKKSEGEDGYEENAKLWNVLEQAITKAEGHNAITVGDLANGFDLDKVDLNTVLKEVTDTTDPEYDSNHKFWTILRQATIGDEQRSITVGDLANGFEINNVLLSDVIKKDDTSAENRKLWEILESAVNVKNPEKGITLDDLNYGFSVDNIALSSVLTKPEGEANIANYNKLTTIISEAIGKDFNEITVTDLSSGFNIDNVKIDSVISAESAEGNKILQGILGQDYKVSEIGDAINGLDITEIFEIECFTNSASKAADTSARYTYNSNAKTYTLSSSGNYYVSKDAKIWLFMMYDANGVSSATGTKGAINTYTAKSVRFSDLEDNMSGMSDTLMNATVKQLLQAGILSETTSGQYSNIYDKSIKQVFDAAALI